MLHDVFTVGQRVSLAGLKDPGHVSQARQVVVDYFRAAPGSAEAEVLARLRALEDVSPAMVAALAQEGPFYEAEPAGEEVRQGPFGWGARLRARPRREGRSLTPGKSSAPGASRPEEAEPPGSSQVEYVLVTPTGYDPRRSYPLLVACQGEGGDGRQASERWRQPCQAHGYLLACPTLPYGEAGYGATAAERAAVLATVEDVARTYHVDPDRVFLTGVSAGGNAVWDVGLHHADRFAGLIPESGTPLHEGTAFTQYLYLRNAEGGLAVYALVGEADAGIRDICAEATKRLQALGVDAQSVVVPQLGHGAFPTEDDSIFAWMDAHRRNPTPQSVSAQLHRLSQGRVYWVEVTALAQPEWDSTQSVRLRLTAPAGTIGEEEALELARAKVAQDLPSVRASVGKDNTVTVSAIGVGELVVWLSPHLVDFSRPVTIVVNGVTVWSRPVTAEPAVLLGEMKRSWDLGRVFFAAVECDLVAKTARVREGK
jgi:dienelactone hydrolase